MKALLAFCLAALSSAFAAQLPGFIKVGNVYSFALAGQREPIVAAILKDEGEGWVRISAIESGDEFWLNIAQVQVAVPVEDRAEAIKAAIERNKILSNLREIAGAVDRYRASEGKDPSIGEILQPGYAGALRSVAGEDYRSVDISGDKPLVVKTKDGVEYTYPRH